MKTRITSCLVAVAILVSGLALLGGGASANNDSATGSSYASLIGSVLEADRRPIVGVSTTGGASQASMVDHDLSTKWSTSTVPTDIVLDLGTDRRVFHTSLSFVGWDDGHRYDYAIDVSNNGSAWTEIAVETSDVAEWSVAEFAVHTTRFVRIRLLSVAPATSTLGLWEAEVWGPSVNTPDVPVVPPAPTAIPTSTSAPFPTAVPTSPPAPTAVPTSPPAPTAVPTSPPAPTAVPTSPPAPTAVPTSPPAPTPVPTSPPAPTAVPTSPPAPTPVPTSPPAPGGVVAESGLLAFDGVDDYVNLNTLEVSGNAFTAEAWINSADLMNCAAGDCRVISKATSTSNDDHVWMISSLDVDGAKRLRFRLRAGGSTSTLVAGSTGELANNTWYHVAATYDGVKMRLFINGVIVGSMPKTGAIASAPTVPVWVGANPTQADARPWEGWIDEVRIWNVARGAGQLSGAMDTELTGSEPGLVAYYRFNEGHVANDIAGSNDAVLGAATFADPSDPSLLPVWPDPAEPPPAPTPVPTTPPNPNGGNCDYTNPNQPFDDPNPPINSSGTSGRLNVSSNPVPAGYPTPLTTGICGVGLEPSDLTPSSGFTVTQDGAVIDGMDISGTLIINANNVTVRNTRITSGSRYVLDLQNGYSGLVVEDTRLRSTGRDPDAVVMLKGFATFNRVHLTGAHDGMKSYGGVLVENSYFTGQYRDDGSHNDVVQIRSGSNYTFRNNTLIGPWRNSTSVFIIQAKGGNISNVLLENNYLSGGGFTVYTTETSPYSLTNAVLRNNRIELDSYSYNWNTNSGGATKIGNQTIPS